MNRTFGCEAVAMLTEFEQRVAELAISRFGVDAQSVNRLNQPAVRAAMQQGDLVDSLVSAKLISPKQASQLRDELDKTDPDIQTLPPKASGNGSRLSSPPASTAKPEELQSIGGHRLLRRLGEGGMGEVYLAYDEANQRQVAIKVLALHLAANQGLVERFIREAEHSGKLNHPNIVHYFGVGKDEHSDRHYLVMEYVDGSSTQVLLDERGKLPIGDTVRIILETAKALEHAHSRNIIHRDIKPENILLTKSGVAKLADLGLARQTDQDQRLTATRQGFGTPYYVAYEQAINAKSADVRSDIFALGATLYHMATGKVPFDGTNQLEIVQKKERGSYTPARSIDPSLPKELEDILGKALARRPEKRYQTVTDLIVDLERSQLADPILSFADQELAEQDPLVRARISSPAAATHFDLHKAEQGVVSREQWIVRYNDSEGRLREAKANTALILKQIREGKLDGGCKVRLPKDEEFQSLADVPQFSQALEEQLGADDNSATAPGILAKLLPRNKWILIGLAAVGFLAVLLLLWIWLS